MLNQGHEPSSTISAPTATSMGKSVSPSAATPTPPAKRAGLKLSQILASLSEGVVIEPAQAAGALQDPPSAGGPAHEVLLYPAGASGRRAGRARTNITVGEIIDRTRQAGFGVMLALLALLAMPVPGMSVLFGLVIALGALQMIIGFDRPWMPKSVRRHRVSVRTLKWLSLRVAHWTRGVEKVIRPRFEFVTRGLFLPTCGLCVLFEALGLALPLPIPFSNSIFSIPIIVYAVALLEADGLLMVFGYALTTLQVVLGLMFWNQVVQSLLKLWNWLADWV